MLAMLQSAGVRVVGRVDGVPRLPGYIVHMVPEGGEAVGKWSGSGNLDAANRIAYRDIPPGRYVLKGQPNPSRGNDHSDAVTIDLKGGQTLPVTLRAR